MIKLMDAIYENLGEREYNKAKIKIKQFLDKY